MALFAVFCCGEKKEVKKIFRSFKKTKPKQYLLLPIPRYPYSNHISNIIRNTKVTPLIIRGWRRGPVTKKNKTTPKTGATLNFFVASSYPVTMSPPIVRIFLICLILGPILTVSAMSRLKWYGFSSKTPHSPQK